MSMQKAHYIDSTEAKSIAQVYRIPKMCRFKVATIINLNLISYWYLMALLELIVI